MSIADPRQGTGQVQNVLSPEIDVLENLPEGEQKRSKVSSDFTGMQEHTQNEASTILGQRPSSNETVLHSPQDLAAHNEDSSSTPAPAPAPTAAPKSVFSLFLSPEQRKMKLEAEAAASATIVTPGKRGRKPKNKGLAGLSSSSASSILPNATSSTTGNSKPPVDPKTIVDPNISKTGETHKFFQEVKASQLLAAGSASAHNGQSLGLTGGATARRFNSKPQEPPFPLQEQQFHGPKTIGAINGVTARLCGIDTSSTSKSLPSAITHAGQVCDRTPPTRTSSKSRDRIGWYALRASPDLGIQAPQYKLKPRGKDCWTHWGSSTVTSTTSTTVDRDQKWRAWSEHNLRLQKPTDKERHLVSNRPSPPSTNQSNQEFEFNSCKRVAEKHELWQQTWASALLSSAGLTPGSAEVAASLDLKVGELWTDKYKPSQGSDVLGNRPKTEYLTQWLKGLEVSGWSLNPEESCVDPGSGAASGLCGLGPTKKTSDIMGTSRKRRKRPRRKGATDLDDFVVYDDADDFEDPYGYLSEEDDGFFAVHRPLSKFSQLAHSGDPSIEKEDIGGSRTMPKLVDIKSNAILLSGPTGSCKTAAVYACAEESGYEVFEVSPGTRRTGKEVLGLVGEMAENHHVHVVPGKTDAREEIHHLMGSRSQDSPAATPAPTPAPVSAIHSFFRQTQHSQEDPRGTGRQPRSRIQDNEDEAMEEASSDVDVDGHENHDSRAFTNAHSHSNDTQGTRSSNSTTTSSSSPSSRREDEQEGSLASHEDTLSDLYSLLTTTNPRQSLILLEEVDILFEDDKGFWASIVALLSKSRRPVVMTCNNTSKIPAATFRFQEHLEFTRPGLRELHQYLLAICKIEGYICSSEYILSLIKHCRHDVRRCLMQLQYDSGVVRSRPAFAGSLAHSSSSSFASSRSASPVTEASPPYSSSSNSSSSANGLRQPASGSPLRKKPQRLLRISAKGIVPASAPTVVSGYTSGSRVESTPLQELERLEVQTQYAEAMSYCDSSLRMKANRAFQCYEIDQFEASKDDVVGQHFAIYKRPLGSDHLLLDQEVGYLVREGCESLYLHQVSQCDGFVQPHRFEDVAQLDEPARSVADNFVPLNESMSRNLQNMQPALEQTLSLQGLRFNLDVTFGTYAPMLRSMIQAEAINTVVPTGKRTMRSGGHLKRHLDMLLETERALILASAFPGVLPHHIDSRNENNPDI